MFDIAINSLEDTFICQAMETERKALMNYVMPPQETE
jgi:hypothetical protein